MTDDLTLFFGGTIALLLVIAAGFINERWGKRTN